MKIMKIWDFFTHDDSREFRASYSLEEKNELASKWKEHMKKKMNGYISMNGLKPKIKSIFSRTPRTR